MSAEKIVLDYAQEAGFSSVLRLSDPLYEESVVLGIGPVLLVDSDNMPLAYLVCPSKCRLYGKEFDHYAIVIPYEVNFGDDVGADTFYLHIRLSEDEAQKSSSSCRSGSSTSPIRSGLRTRLCSTGFILKCRPSFTCSGSYSKFSTGCPKPPNWAVQVGTTRRSAKDPQTACRCGFLADTL